MKETYPPLNRLKPIAPDLWIVDGPTIRYGPGWFKLSFPTRMTIVRIGSDLLVHSPTPLTEALHAELRTIGTPRWLVGPNRLHYWWIPEWKRAFPAAEVYLAPGIEAQARGRIAPGHHALDGPGDWPWSPPVETIAIRGRYITEVVFFDTRSRTLILTDLIENFEREKLSSRFTRWLTWIAGAQDPHGSMPRDMRLTYAPFRSELEAVVRTMIGWQPERVILAHGRWYDRNGTDELRRAFDWLVT